MSLSRGRSSISHRRQWEEGSNLHDLLNRKASCLWMIPLKALSARLELATSDSKSDMISISLREHERVIRFELI